MDPQFCWKMEDLYATDADWEAEYAVLDKKIAEFQQLQGTLKNGKEDLLAVLKASDACNKLLERVYVYANQRYHQDTGNQTYQAMAGKASTIFAKLQDASAFVEPEILELDEEMLQQWLDGFPTQQFELVRVDENEGGSDNE